MYAFDSMNPVLWLILTILQTYFWVVIVAVVMSWLVAFGVVNPYNPFIRSVGRFLYVLTEPVFRLVRRIVPTLGGLDLSPMIVAFGIIFLQRSVVWLYIHYLYQWLP